MAEVLHGLPAGGIVARNVRHPGETWQRRRLDDLAGSESETVSGSSIDLWFAELEAFSSVDSDALATLSVDECDRATRMLDAESRRDWQRSRALLRRILARYLPAGSTLEIELGSHGKPRLRSQSPNPLYFNLSHHRRRETSAGWILAISRAGEVGVDLEAVRPVPNALRLAERVFSTAERAELATLYGESTLRGDRLFLEIWTRKEALLKALGDGFTRSASSLHVGSSDAALHRGATRIDVPDAATHEVCTLHSPVEHLLAVATAFTPTRWRLNWLIP